LVITGLSDPGPLRTITVQVIVSLPGVGTIAVMVIPSIIISSIVVSSAVIPSIVITSGTTVSVTVMGIPVTPVAIVRRPVPVSSRPPATIMAMVPIMIAMPVTTGVVRNVERSPAPTQTEIPATPGVVTDMKAPGSIPGIVIIG